MRRIWNNIRTWDDFMNTVLTGILFIIIKVLNSCQYIKMGYYKIFGIPCYMITDHKFGEKICYIKDKK